MSTLNSTTGEATEFVFLCFTGHWSWWKGILWAIFLILFLVALSSNFVLLLVIIMDRRLHQPMYYFLCFLSMLDLTMCFLVNPQVLINLWSESNTISAAACFIQTFLISTFFGSQSGMFMVMAFDRYVAVCKPLQYHAICSNSFVLKAAAVAVGKNAIVCLPLAVLTARQHYCASNVIVHCYCENVSVTSLACDNDPIIPIYLFVMIWFTTGFDMAFIIFSYCMIFRAVVHLRSKEALAKAFNTCASHLIVMSYYYCSEIAILISKTVGNNISADVHTLLAILFSLVPQVLNPLVYGMQTKLIRERILQIFRYKEWFKHFQM